MAGLVVLDMLRRRVIRRERLFRDHTNPLDSYNEDELYEAFRFRRHDILSLCDELADIDLLHRQGSLSVPLQVCGQRKCEFHVNS